MMPAGTSSSGDELLVTVTQHTAFVRVRGRGSFKNSPALKEFVNGVLDRGEARRVVLDMEECTGMDSTFMGVLAGIAFRMRREGGDGVTLVNLSSRTLGLLATLGLDHVVQTHLSGRTPPELAGPLDAARGSAPLETKTAPGDQAKTMLEAHTMLVEVTPENQPKFRDVIEYLKRSVEQG